VARRKLGTVLGALLAGVLLSLIVTGALLIDLALRRVLTPTLVDAVQRMSFWEALLSPKAVLDLWIAVRIASSPASLAAFAATLFVLGALAYLAILRR